MRAFLRTATIAVSLLLPFASPAQEAETPPPQVSALAPDISQAGPLGEKALGDPAAPVTMIEYVSMTCNHCGAFYKNTFALLKAKYIDTGKVYFILREFPLDPLALAAAMTAHCGPDDEYFAIIDDLFLNQEKWAYIEDPAPALVALLTPHGFTEESFSTCIKDQTIVEGIVEVAQRGQALGVEGTPAFFINGEKYSGAMDMDRIDTVLAPLLEGAVTE
jgi:protein-disulfide isomerase